MTDEPNRPPDTTDETRGRTEAEGADDRQKAAPAATPPQQETVAPSSGEVEAAGTLPPPPDNAAQRPTPESQAALTGKAPSGSSVAGTTVPAASDAGEASATTPTAAPAETPEQKKARLIAEHKAKLAAKAAAQAEGAAGGEKTVPGGASPAVGDPTQSPSQADLEKAAKIAEAKARAAAMKEAAGAKTPAAAGTAGAAGAPKAPVKKKDEGPKPEDASGHPLVKRLRERFADAVTEATTFLGQLSLNVARASVVEVCRHLRDDAETPFNYLSDLTCVHWPERLDAPFEVVYNLYSIPANQRVRLRVAVDEAEGVESVTGVWPSANWMEREVFDLYGVRFANHPDLRRLLLPADWTGHPFRKDYPLEFMENDWTTRHLPEFTEVQREQMEQRRAYGLELLSTPDERRVREIFRAGKELLPKEHR